jgi:hypothetical protein
MVHLKQELMMANTSAIAAPSAVSTGGANASGKQITQNDLLKFVMGSIVLRDVMTEAFKTKNDDKNAAAAVGSFAALMFTA